MTNRPHASKAKASPDGKRKMIGRGEKRQLGYKIALDRILNLRAKSQNTQLLKLCQITLSFFSPKVETFSPLLGFALSG
ncbi:MAG TPA: hypothetical protein VGC89_02360 [Pyrinomonadaceae bacterium]